MKKRSSQYACLVICCFAAISIFSCKSNNGGTAVQTPQPVSVTTVNATSDALQAKYNSAQAKIDELMTERSQMDSQLNIKNNEITIVKRKLKHEQKNSRAYAAKLKTQKLLVEKLTADSRAYADRLDKIQAQNGLLQMQRDSLLHQYLALHELGSVLHASNIRMVAIHLKHHGTKEKKTVKARKVNELRVNFDIDENRIAENGNKKIYLVITGPDGVLLGSNVVVADIMPTADGNNMKYSVLKEIALTKGEPVKDVTVDWKQDGDYKKGIYKITLYNGGYKIGAGNVNLI